MINQKNLELGKVRSVIRELFEYGKQLKNQRGEENVFDFSLGNPSVPTPEYVTQRLQFLIGNGNPVQLHGYTSAQGDYDVRRAVASDLNSRFNANFSADEIYMTCGAAASLTITLNALINCGDEVVVLAPYFPEYAVFVANAGAKLVVVNCDENTLQPDVQKIKDALSPKTKAIIVNSPNNPSGVIYDEQILKSLAQVLAEHEKATGNTIYLISDEPYRELVYDGKNVPFVANYYANTVVCYSFSKSLSLPGERIGYVALNPQMPTKNDVYFAVMGSGRALGYVCAPTLFQYLVKDVVGKPVDVSTYQTNRDLLCSALKEFGYDVINPDGAFYLFIKTPCKNADEFMDRAKEYGILLVSSKSFGMDGYARIAYCVSTDLIKRSLPSFKLLIESYK